MCALVQGRFVHLNVSGQRVNVVNDLFGLDDKPT